MKGITVFLLGGVAEIPEESRRPAAEFWMALAGPAASLVLAALCFGLFQACGILELPPHWNGIPGYLSIVNEILAVFNLVPRKSSPSGGWWRTISTASISRPSRYSTMERWPPALVCCR